MPKKYNFNIEEILNMIDLYQIGIPTSTIAALYSVNNVTLWNHLKKYEKLNFFQFRTRSQTILITLSKSRTKPIGEKENRVKSWLNNFGIEGLKDILTVIFLTDGSSDLKNKIVRLANSDAVFLSIFIDLLNKLNLEPRETLDKRKNTLRVIFARNNKVKRTLEEIRLTRTPTTKHQPQRGTQNWEIYLKEEQPTLSFLFDRNKKLLELLFRIGISLEGAVFINKKHERIFPMLNFTCFHPILIKEWKELMEQLGFQINVRKNVLRIRNVLSILNFLMIGGFIEGVVNCGKSRYFKGIEKNKVLLGILEYAYQEREELIPKETNTIKINNTIKKIIQNNQYKEKEFYIAYFSKLC